MLLMMISDKKIFPLHHSSRS